MVQVTTKLSPVKVQMANYLFKIYLKVLTGLNETANGSEWLVNFSRENVNKKSICIGAAKSSSLVRLL